MSSHRRTEEYVTLGHGGFSPSEPPRRLQRFSEQRTQALSRMGRCFHARWGRWAACTDAEVCFDITFTNAWQWQCLRLDSSVLRREKRSTRTESSSLMNTSDWLGEYYVVGLASSTVHFRSGARVKLLEVCPQWLPTERRVVKGQKVVETRQGSAPSASQLLFPIHVAKEVGG